MDTSYNPFSLSGKTILITGASSGIGQATAIECSRMGASLLITGRDHHRLDETFNQLDGSGHQKLIADLNQEVQLNELVGELPNLDGIVHSAGIVKTLPFQFIDRGDLTTIFDINFMAPVLLSQKLIKAKKINKESSVVFLASIDGPLIAHVGNSMYAASKGALSAMVKTMALELASKRIRINCVYPGMIDTPLIHRDDITEEQLAIELKKYPIKRYGKPEEVAYAIIYLLSDASTWVTGTNIIVDGGFTLI